MTLTGITSITKKWIQCLCLVVAATAVAKQPNVLFIAIDDLRPELGCYDHPMVKSPNIDRIAREGMVFDRAYCQQAVCGPSRLSLMTGVHLDRVKIYNMGTRIEWREERPGISSLSEQFRNAGWTAVGFGKIYDGRLGLDVGYSWDAFTEGWKPKFARPDNRMFNKKQRGVRMPAVECADVPDQVYTDGSNARLAVNLIEQYDGEKPLFLAVGFCKPHLPFVAPKKYWDLYDRDAIVLPENKTAPTDCTEYTLSKYKEIFSYAVDRPISDETARELIHGYYACISYVDAQVGAVVDALEKKKMLENTIIVLWGDHGFKLGDYGEWAKNTNLEVDTRVPLMMSLPPDMAMERGAKTKSVVELVDLFPTLCEAAGLPVPDTVEGRSLLPVLRNPETSVKNFALSQFPHGDCMGYSIRDSGWRYTEWRALKGGEIKARELYDLRTSLVEDANVLNKYPEEASKRAAMLQDYLNQAITWDGDLIW